MTDQVKPIGDDKPTTDVKTPEVVTAGSTPAKTPEVVAAPKSL